MGGILIKLTLLKNPVFLKRKWMIFTLGTPHQTPPLSLNRAVFNLYKKLSLEWDSLENVGLISIAGGSLDKTVDSKLCLTPKSSSQQTFFSSQITDVWTVTDHLSILWCNQLIRKLSLFLVYEWDERQLLRKTIDQLRENFKPEKHVTFQEMPNAAQSFESFNQSFGYVKVQKIKKNIPKGVNSLQILHSAPGFLTFFTQKSSNQESKLRGNTMHLIPAEQDSREKQALLQERKKVHFIDLQLESKESIDLYIQNTNDSNLQLQPYFLSLYPSNECEHRLHWNDLSKRILSSFNYFFF
jgi:hypothetical protein